MTVDVDEKLVCEVCNKHRPLERIMVIDRTSIIPDSEERLVCEKCRNEIEIYDHLKHKNSDHGEKFSDLQDMFGLAFPVISKIARESSRLRVIERSNCKRVIIS